MHVHIPVSLRGGGVNTMNYFASVTAGLLFVCVASTAAALDIDGVVEHPMIERYPGQDIAWQHIENYQP